MELISKKKVMEIINRHKCDTSEIILGVIELPTVEAKEVVHAKWIDGCCSNCGAYIPTDSLWDYISGKECNFCYSCGCDMRGENDVE